MRCYHNGCKPNENRDIFLTPLLWDKETWPFSASCNSNTSIEKKRRWHAAIWPTRREPLPVYINLLKSQCADVPIPKKHVACQGSILYHSIIFPENATFNQKNLLFFSFDPFATYLCHVATWPTRFWVSPRPPRESWTAAAPSEGRGAPWTHRRNILKMVDICYNDMVIIYHYIPQADNNIHILIYIWMVYNLYNDNGNLKISISP
jgi:hypothetical protein